MLGLAIDKVALQPKQLLRLLVSGGGGQGGTVPQGAFQTEKQPETHCGKQPHLHLQALGFGS